MEEKHAAALQTLRDDTAEEHAENIKLLKLEKDKACEKQNKRN